jgi:hypothetical protein
MDVEKDVAVTFGIGHMNVELTLHINVEKDIADTLETCHMMNVMK